MNPFKQAFRQNHLILSLGLGLFLLLAGSTSFTSAWMMTIALAINLIVSTSLIYAIRKSLDTENRWLVIMLIMATVATLVQMLAVAFVPYWMMGLETLLPLIAISGLILARVDTVVMTGQYRDVILDAFGSILGFAFVILPIGLFADFFGLGVFQFAFPTTEAMLWSFTLLPEALRLPIFTGASGPIGILLLAALWIALLRAFRGKQA